MKNKKGKTIVLERPSEFEFYHLVKFAIHSLPKRVKKEIAGTSFVLNWDLIKWRGNSINMAEYYLNSKNIAIYPHEVILDAGVRGIAVQDSVVSIIEHEVAHLYGLSHDEIKRRRKEKIPMFRGVKFPDKKKSG